MRSRLGADLLSSRHHQNTSNNFTPTLVFILGAFEFVGQATVV
jgi:hypothetical protein